MGTVRTLRPFILLVLCIGLTACQTEQPAPAPQPKCPEIAGEHHYKVAKAQPSGQSMMLHIVKKMCATAGENTFRLYVNDMNGDGASNNLPKGPLKIESGQIRPLSKHSQRESGQMRDTPVRVLDDRRIVIDFPSQGDWGAEFQFALSPSATTQTVRWTFDVQAP